MIKKNKSASMIVYVMIVLFIAIVIGYVVLNKTFILTNNFTSGVNSQEIYEEASKKANASLKMLRDYNSNSGDKFLDSISCPGDVSVNYGTGVWQVGTHLVIDEGKNYCEGIYAGEKFRISLSNTGSDRIFFTQVSKLGETKDLQRVISNDIVYNENQISSANISSSDSSDTSNLSDGNENTIFSMENSFPNYKLKYIDLSFTSEKNIEKIIIKKPLGKNYLYRYIITYSDDSKEYSSTKNFSKEDSKKILYFQYKNLLKPIKNIRIETISKMQNLYIADLEIYTYELNGQKPMWKTNGDFSSGVIKTISFNSNGISGIDGVDDDLDNDDYKVSSTYQDDDVVPRLTFFGSIKSNDLYYSIFWNNYKTDKLIDENTNNNDNLNKKSSWVEEAYFYLDFNGLDSYNYDLKILEFDKQKYKNKNILVLNKSYLKNNLSTSSGIIQNNNGNLSLGNTIGTETFKFDLKNKNYALFIKNNIKGGILNYKLTAKTSSGANIYINPINDSGTGEVEILANHMFIGTDNSYVGDNFKIIGKKYLGNTEDSFKPKTCLEILNSDSSTKNNNGYYNIYIDSANPTLVYCDMTTGGGGWTRYVNIKGNYSFENAKSCWLGDIISNDNLECFNPNRFDIDVKQLMNNDWSGQYIYNIPIANVGADVSSTSDFYQRRCLGNKEFMTIMKEDSYPNTNASEISFLRLGKNYCGFNREVGGMTFDGLYMNYSRNFGENSGRKRESNAKTTKLYFREEVKNTTKVVSYKLGKRWDNGTYAKSCDEYKNPKGGYEYSGDIGDGDYYIDTDGDGGNEEFLIHCDMIIDLEG